MKICCELIAICLALVFIKIFATCSFSGGVPSDIVFIKDDESLFSVSGGVTLSQVSARILENIPQLSRTSKEYMLKNKNTLLQSESLIGTRHTLLSVPGIGDKNVKNLEKFFHVREKTTSLQPLNSARDKRKKVTTRNLRQGNKKKLQEHP